jgi:hypothetical protein
MPTIISDGASGMIIAWHDNRNSSTSSWDIYARGVGPTGVELVKFSVLPHQDKVELLWQSEIEMDVYKWLIVRSTEEEIQESSNWIQVGELPAKGSFSKYRYVDHTVVAGKTYYYKLGDMKSSGNVIWYGPVKVICNSTNELSMWLSLSIWNPFREKLEITYIVPGYKPCFVTLNVYNSVGKLIKQLVNKIERPGMKTVYWDAKGTKNNLLSTGVYFCQLEIDGNRISRKAVHINY